jgi:transcriptional regulator with XRE-family HTH domain
MPTEHNKTKVDIDPRSQRIADKIKELRIQKGYTSHENFAWDFEINRVQYWRIEKGSNITIKTLLAILDIHKVSLSDFFKDID